MIVDRNVLEDGEGEVWLTSNMCVVSKSGRRNNSIFPTLSTTYSTAPICTKTSLESNAGLVRYFSSVLDVEEHEASSFIGFFSIFKFRIPP